MSRITAHGKEFETFLTHETIQKRINEICKIISEKYAGKTPVFLGIMNGAFMFAAEVMKQMTIECEISFVKLKSYIGDQSSGEVTQMLGLDCNLAGRDVIILEDIVDSGRTLHYFFPELQKSQPASVSLFTLLVKPDALKFEVPIDYAGFAVPNLFLIGFGLDYDGLGRNLSDIYQAVV
jgi:hypoxanthine phosphoribosyltransferase